MQFRQLRLPFSTSQPATTNPQNQSQHLCPLKRRQATAPAEKCGTFHSTRRSALLSFFGTFLAHNCSQPAISKTTSGSWTSPGLAQPVDDNAPKFYTTSSGVKIQEIGEGRGGQEVQSGDSVLFDYVLRRSNGYFIYATVEGVSFQPKDVPVGPVYLNLADEAVIPGLKEVLIGMQQGAKRRALIPASMGYIASDMQPQPPTFGARRQLLNHLAEPLIFEVQLLRVNP